MPVYSIAGVGFGYQPLFSYCAKELSPYKSDCNPDFNIKLNVEALENERSAYPEAAPQLIESLCLCRLLTEKLTEYDCFLLHASAVSYKRRAYLFTAPSGTGKSTHTALWLKAFPEAEIINDDKPYIRLIDGVWCACGSPWSGKDRRNSNRIDTVGGICVLKRSAENEIVPISSSQILAAIIPQMYIPKQPRLSEAALNLAQAFAKAADGYRLGCNMDVSAAKLSNKVMSQKYGG